MPNNVAGLPTYRGHLLALLAGLIAPLAFAPFNFWPIAIASVVLLLFCIVGSPIKQSALRGWLYGVGFFGSGVSWVYVSIHEFGAASPLLAATLTLLFVMGISLFFALHLALYRWLIPTRQEHNPWILLIGFASVWVLAEWFRSWFLTGFPWLYLGYAPMDTWLTGWSPVSGIYSLSFMSAIIASAIFILIRSRTTGIRKNQQVPLHPTPLMATLSILLIPFASGLGLQQIQWTTPKDEKAIKVTLVQGNVAQNLKWKPAQRQGIIQGYISQTLPHLNSDLIIWPETSIPQLLDLARPTLAPFEDLLQDNNVGLITGIPSRQSFEDRTRYYNSIVGLASAEGIYHKQRLVPFGEYVPLEEWLRGLIDFFDLPMSNFSLGQEDQAPLILANQQNIAPFICYEIAYPDLVAKNSRGVDYLLTVSNDSWFGDSVAPHQHLQMARMRAMENGRYLIRATNNGISAIVDNKGQLVNKSEQFIRTSLTEEIVAYSGTTPFTRLGSWPIISLCILMLLGIKLLRRKPASSPRVIHSNCSH